MKALLSMKECPTPVRKVLIEELSQVHTDYYHEPWFKVLDCTTGIRVYASVAELSLSGVGAGV